MLALLLMAVSGAWATITVTWNNDDITGSGNSFTKDGVTITAGYIDFGSKNFENGGTFTTTLGNFTKIEVTTSEWDASGTGWSGSTWTGNASSVSFSGGIYGDGMGNTKFVFTIEPSTVAVTGVTLAPTSATLTLGETETVTLIPTVLPADATDKSVTWSSSNEAVATVTDGVVTAVAAGEATITVTTTDGAKTATCAVTVAAPAASTYTVTLKEGTEDATSWTIAPAEATTAGVAAGTTVTATYSGAKKVKSVKAVKKAAAAVPVTAITLNKTETSIEVGSTETLSVTAVAPDNATDKTYTWKTSDETKATVDQDGKVTAVAAGTVTIYAEENDGSGVKGNCTVTVTPATITVTWNSTNVFNSSNADVKIWNNNKTATYEGVTISFTGSGAVSYFKPYDIDGQTKLFVNVAQGGAYSFTAPSGKIFTKIEIINSGAANLTEYGDWTKPASNKIIWSGAASSTVTLAPPSGSNVNFLDITSIVFTMKNE